MCALKVALSTAKGKRMPLSTRHHALVRALRIMAVLSPIVALAAVATIMNGDSTAKSHALIAVSIMLGSSALLGLAVLALPHAYRKKDKHDPRP
jgi:hypothetical protein